MKTTQTTYCKRFDNSCYHHQCIANWTAVIMLQVLIGHSGEKRCEKSAWIASKSNFANWQQQSSTSKGKERCKQQKMTQPRLGLMMPWWFVVIQPRGTLLFSLMITITVQEKVFFQDSEELKTK